MIRSNKWERTLVRKTSGCVCAGRGGQLVCVLMCLFPRQHLREPFAGMRLADFHGQTEVVLTGKALTPNGSKLTFSFIALIRLFCKSYCLFFLNRINTTIFFAISLVSIFPIDLFTIFLKAAYSFLYSFLRIHSKKLIAPLKYST